MHPDVYCSIIHGGKTWKTNLKSTLANFTEKKYLKDLFDHKTQGLGKI